MQAEIISIGTELLLGEIVDTNAAWIAKQLAAIGLNLYYQATVGDNLDRITSVMHQSLERSDIVITTGGLGPTVDDMTRDAVAAATDRALVLDEQLLNEITCFFANRHYQMTDNNRKQAYIPQGARIIHNPVGTAPAFGVERDGHVIISLPGVPHEMRYLMEHDVLPFLRERFDLHGVIQVRIVHTCGIGESTIDSQIDDLMRLSNPTVGTAAHLGQTDIRIAAKADSAEQASSLIEPVEAQLVERLGEFIYGYDAETLAGVVAKLLQEREMSLAVVDTTLGGEFARAFTEAGPSTALAGSVAASTQESVARALDLDGQSLAEWGQGSAAVAAQAVARTYHADLGLAIMGPPDMGAEGAPPVYFALSQGDCLVQRPPRQGRAGPAGRGWVIHLALDLVRRYLLGLSTE